MVFAKVERDLENFAFVLEVPGVSDTSSLLGDSV